MAIPSSGLLLSVPYIVVQSYDVSDSDILIDLKLTGGIVVMIYSGCVSFQVGTIVVYPTGSQNTFVEGAEQYQLIKDTDVKWCYPLAS